MESHEHTLLPPGAPTPEGFADAGQSPPAAHVAALLEAGRPVLVTLVPGSPAEPDTGLLAAASVYAWLGVTAFRAPESHFAALDQVLDMVASIRGTRRPALARRALA